VITQLPNRTQVFVANISVTFCNVILEGHCAPPGKPDQRGCARPSSTGCGDTRHSGLISRPGREKPATCTREQHRSSYAETGNSHWADSMVRHAAERRKGQGCGAGSRHG
jgi:hypothetical protein